MSAAASRPTPAETSIPTTPITRPLPRIRFTLISINRPSTAPSAASSHAVSEWFKANPGHSLFLAGHADKRGTPEYNRALGERRALAVREYLVGLGLPAASLYTNSYGSDRPAVDGDTEEAYAKNRRVEIGVIVQK